MAAQPDAGRALNFLCTHDGIYLRLKAPPLPPEALEILTAATILAGGAVIRREVGGEPMPCELDVALPDLLDGPDERMHERLLGALTLILGLPGVPMLYLGTLMAIRNAHGLVAATGDARAINRGTLSLSEARNLTSGDSAHTRFLARLGCLVEGRRRLDAFSPEAGLRRLEFGESVVAFERLGRHSWAGCFLSLSHQATVINLPPGCVDLETGRVLPERFALGAHQPLMAGRAHD